LDQKKKYRLLLISPKQEYIGYTAHVPLARMFGKKRLMIPLALPLVAAYTPDNYEIRIIDEETEQLPDDFHPDIVGITTLNATMPRSFELGDRFRAAGVKVIMGGINASVLPEEYLEHSDSVVIGEAENAWEKCLSDFEKGELKKRYEADPKHDYRLPRKPRWDLVNTSLIMQVAVQATRGCPFRCDFCLVSTIFGTKMRFREIDNIIEEISTLPSKYVFFVDDNLTINKKYAHQLMERLKPLAISWACMASIDVADDEILLRKMADAGCFNILIGFESLNPGSLNESHKIHNEEGRKFADAINKIHRAGIHINGSFIVGFDNDTTDELERIYDFSLANGLANVNLHILASPPGSVLNKRLSEDGRIFRVPSGLGAGFFPTVHYARMGQIELFDKYMSTLKRLYSWETILIKARNLFGYGSFTRRGSDISFLLKFRFTAIILSEFLLTSDRSKRKLLFFLVSLMKSGKVSPDKAFSFMLTMLSSNRQIKHNSKKIPFYRSLIALNDQGPWMKS
jgi:radical SAM superfamily enzyme YgiQ (UPF0313 family)